MSQIIILLPLATLLVLAVWTRKMAEAMVAAAALAMVILHKGNVIEGTIASFYRALSDDSLQFCIIFLIAFGSIIRLLQESGGLQGFARFMSRFIRGPRSALFFCWIIAGTLFVDEYLNTLTVGFTMRGITDRCRIPREHLAFQVNAMACALVLIVPFTSWTGFTIKLIEKEGMGFVEYVQAIAVMFYPVIAVVLCLLLALGLFPRLGALKKAYARVETGGPVYVPEEQGKSILEFAELDEGKISSPLNLLLPLVVIVGGAMWFDKNMLVGLLLGLVCQFLLYLPQRLMSVSMFFDFFFQGASSMLTLIMVLFFGFVLGDANEQMGVFDLVVGLASASVPAWVIPALTFLMVAALVFTTGTCWVVMLITIPIFLPLAAEAGVSTVLTLGALMSGVGMGYNLCFYADTMFLTAAGTGVNNMGVVRVSLPYAAIVGGLSLVCYLAAGVLA